MSVRGSDGDGNGSSRRRLGALAAVSAGWLLIQLGRQALAPLLPRIIEELSITGGQAGFVLTALSATYALFHYPGGRLADGPARKAVVVGGLGVVAGGFAVMTAVRSYPALLAAAVVVGAGSGVFFVSMRVLVSELYPDGRGRAFGANMAAGNAGVILASALVGTVLLATAWQGLYAWLVAAVLATTGALHLLVGGSYESARPGLRLRETLGDVFGDPRIRRLAVAYSLFVFVWQGASKFLPTFLQAEKAFGPALASGAFGLIFLVGTVVMPAAGAVGDRLSHVGVSLGALGLTAAGLLGVVLAAGTLPVLGAVVVFAVGLMAFPPAMQAHLFRSFDDAGAGGTFGAFKMVYSGVGSLGPTYVGVVGGRLGYDAAFVVMTACLVASALVIVRGSGSTSSSVR